MAAARRICLVTGGNKGIGRSICKLLAREPNHHIILTARNESLGAAAVEELAYPNIEFMQLYVVAGGKSQSPFNLVCRDITSHESRERLSHEIQGKFGKIDVLINNAGIAFKGNSWGEEVARKTLDSEWIL